MLKKHDNKKVVSSRIHGAIEDMLNEMVEKRDISESEVVREALSVYFKKFDEVNVREPVQKVMNNQEYFKDIRAEDYYIQKQNYAISTELKGLTFLEFMDKNLALVYMANKPHMGDEELKEMLKETLNTLKPRAEHHGFKDHWKRRTEEPVKFVNEFLERKNLEDKAFDDWMDSMGVK